MITCTPLVFRVAPELPADLEPVEPWDHDVKKDEIRVVLAGQLQWLPCHHRR
jgi:hypothetical protein